MRWSIIRTIWLREMRDQMRDRRTLFMILGLPLLLYPVLGLGVLQFAMSFTEKSVSTFRRIRAMCTSMTLSIGVARANSFHTSCASMSRDTSCPA